MDRPSDDHARRSSVKDKKIAPGIYETPTGYRAFRRVQGELKTKRWKRGETTLTRVKEWWRDQEARPRIAGAFPPTDRTFAQDAREYLQLVRSMPTFAWRKTDIARWVNVLGPDRDRRTITAQEIRKHLERWHADGYAANTLNHRRTALMHLFRTLDGKSAPNPARDVDRYTPEDRGPRGMPPLTVLTILEHMRPSQTKARLSLMAWTGWPQMTLERLKPSHIRWNDQVYVTRRRKGGGVEGAWMPLIAPAWKALREFKRLGCWGSFSRDSMNASWHRAVKKTKDDPDVPQKIKDAIVDGAVPYDLRHSFGTLVAIVTKDDTAVGKALQHSDPRQTAHYMRAAGDPRLRDGLWKVTRQLPSMLKRKKPG
jgi:site-specific recombinase XerD